MRQRTHMKRFHARSAGIVTLAAIAAISFSFSGERPRAIAKEPAPAKAKVTYAGQVARILQENCQNCHHPGTAAPFSLMTYEDAVEWADTIKEAVGDGRMPPWHADPHFGKFSNDRTLTPAEI